MLAPQGMNTKILLAIAGAVALSACGKHKRTGQIDVSRAGRAIPVPLAAVTVQAPHLTAPPPIAPPPPSPPRGDIFRQPDPTKKLPNWRTNTTVETFRRTPAGGSLPGTIDPPKESAPPSEVPPSSNPPIPAEPPQQPPVPIEAASG